MNRANVHFAAAIAVSLLFAAPTSVSAQQKTAMPKPAAAKVALVEAHEQMRVAVAKAHASNKGVFIKFGASWCGPCRGLDRFLSDTTGVGAIMHKYFVIVGMTALENPPLDTLNTPGALQLVKDVGGNLNGVPYFFMLDSDGKKTGDSFYMPDKSNMGHPVTKLEVESFDRLLQVTAPKMTAAERARVKQYLDKDAGR